MSRFAIILFFLLITVVQGSATTDPEIEKYFASKNVSVRIYYERIDSHEIRYFETYSDSTCRQLIFFLHGALSKGMKFKKLMADQELLEKSRMISLDRPGYAASSPGIPMVSIEEQSKVIEHILNGFDYDSVLLVGHSYGAAIMANYAVKYATKNVRLLMLSAAIDPELEVIIPTSYLVKTKVTQEIMSDRTRVAALENFAHENELRKILPIWQKIDFPVMHVHGTSDRVIAPENIEFSIKHIPPRYLSTKKLINAGHMMLRFNSDVVLEAIHHMIDL